MFSGSINVKSLAGYTGRVIATAPSSGTSIRSVSVIHHVMSGNL